MIGIKVTDKKLTQWFLNTDKTLKRSGSIDLKKNSLSNNWISKFCPLLFKYSPSCYALSKA